MMKKLPYLLSLFLLLHGCAIKEINYHGSFVGVHSAQSVSDIIATDIVSFLATKYPASHTEIALLPATSDKKEEDTFSNALENAFRKRGFTLSAESHIIVSYVFDKIENEEYYIQLKINNDTHTRLYSSQGSYTSNWSKLGQ